MLSKLMSMFITAQSLSSSLRRASHFYHPFVNRGLAVRNPKNYYRNKSINNMKRTRNRRFKDISRIKIRRGRNRG